MSTRFGFNVEKEILNEEIGCVLLCKSVPVLTLDVLQIAEESKTHHFSQIGIFLGCTLSYPEVDRSCLLLLRK